MGSTRKDMIVVGGSAGSLSSVISIIQSIPLTFPFTLVLVLHRMRNVNSDMARLLSAYHKGVKVKEPEDKEEIKAGIIYLAPQNYHLLIEEEYTFSLDYSEPVLYSRPSIDVTFQSAAAVYGGACAGILLSGANQDGAEGLACIVANGGTIIAQDPDTADYPAMPLAGIEASKKIQVLPPESIVRFILANC